MARATHSNIRTNIDAYVKEVTSLIHASPAERTRIEADLRAHLQEGLEHGEDPADLITRMGEPREVAAGFMEQLPFVYAGHWPRLAAFMVDMLIILLIAGAAAT